MQRILLTIAALMTLTNVRGQSTEYRISLNSGLFSFTGKSASEVSGINAVDASTPGSTNNVYGSKNGLCYGLSANIQRVTKRHFILGVDAGYEVLRSKVSITGVWLYGNPYPYGVSATGQTYLNNNFVNIFPFLGYRIMAKPITLDITAGLDLAHCFKSQEKGNATDSLGTKYKSSGEVKTIKNDVRPRIQISTGYKKVGVYVGYSYGLTSYMNDYIGIPNESYPRLWRFGLTYQI